MDGKECYQRIREQRPGVRAIFSSGYSGDLLPSEFLEAQGQRLVPKPYNTTTLLTMIDEELAR